MSNLSRQIFISHPASVFELKDSYIIMEGGWGQKHGRGFFGVKSIPCILSKFNLLLKYPAVAPIILINNMVPLKTLFHVIRSISKFLQYLNISGKEKKFHVIFNIILWLEVSRKKPIAYSHVIWFHFSNVNDGAPKYTTLCN